MHQKKPFHQSVLAKTIAILLAPAAGLTATQYAHAQSGGSGGLEQIVVTAQRKTELLQEVPISVNVVTAEALAEKGMISTNELQAAVPGLQYVTTGGAGTPYLRGIGSNAGNPNDEPSVATYIDGVYIASPYANIMGFNNIQRIEVLKGPQGTLFGRNATGGVIQLVTRDPSHTAGLEISAGVANYRTTSGSVYATGEITKNLAADLAVQIYTQDEGWGYNATRQEDTYESRDSSARIKFLLTPNAATEVRVAIDHAESWDTFADYRLPKGVLGIDGQPSPSDEYDTRGNVTLDGIGAPDVVKRQTGISATVNYDTDLLQFVSISAYRENDGVYHAEADTTPQPWVEARLPIFQSNWSQEFQLLSNDETWFDWTAGAYFYGSRAGYRNVVFQGLAFGNPPGSAVAQQLIYGKQETDSQSLYAQGTGEIFAGTKLTAGLRFTHERQSFFSKYFGMAVPSPKDRGFDEPTWRIALDRDIADDVHAYVSYNRGVKGGGFDVLSPGSGGYDPEKLDAYEIGIKSELFDNRLRLNAAYFYYDYQDIQVQVIPAGTQGIVQTTNAAAATVKGLDIDFQYVPVDDMNISGGVAIAHGEYDDFPNTVSYQASPLSGPSQAIDASGNDIIRMPEVSGNLTVGYDFYSDMGKFPVSVTYSYSGSFYFGADNRLEQDAYGLVNASAGWVAPDESYGVTLWGRNLTDEYYLIQGVPSGFGDLTVPGAPRTYGITFNAKFGG